MQALARQFIDFVHRSSSVFHVVENSAELLTQQGFEELYYDKPWSLKADGKYFVKKNHSSLVAFAMGEGELTTQGFRITGNHTDTPGFRIKPNPEVSAEDAYLRLNTEVYGGPILNTWMDRPLSAAGRVMLKSENPLRPETRLVDLQDPILIIPNLAIHQNKDVNSGFELNKQNDTLPVLTLLNDELEKEGLLLGLIAKACDVPQESILDFDLFLYEHAKGELVGLNQEMLSCPKIDNHVSLFCGLRGLLESQGGQGIRVLACFDNEEIGSSTKQGADSNMLLNTLRRIAFNLGLDEEGFYQALYNSFMISVDGAHAVHPAQGAKTDPVIKPRMNQGPAIKLNANQSYTSDAYSVAVVKQILERHQLPYQFFVNRSDARSGSTIGPISSTHLDINAVDLGLPMLAMHSVRELCGTDDIFYLKELLRHYYCL
ncbi:M18 family aminopeptidase [Dongshaea marina]|uniref:M18 family aminopeptidase n=1 Tax=Dongshaea marina TaxID=2047966 RepID=UPI000D3EC4AF|nr:M18 family aminopeptidase [Dongshaea marina]